jgi:hypothetical protein
MDLMWWGAAIGTVYAAIGYFIGDVFLFSNYQLYSSATNRTEGATPAFFADGREARMVDYVDFHGIDPSRIHWYDFPCSVQWMVEEARRWVREHASSEPPTDAVPVVWGMTVFKIAPDGSLTQRFDPLVSGVARRA